MNQEEYTKKSKEMLAGVEMFFKELNINAEMLEVGDFTLKQLEKNKENTIDNIIYAVKKNFAERFFDL